MPQYKKIYAFKLWCWRRLLRVPWTARRLKQSILKEINPEYSLEGLMLKLKVQYFGHLMPRVDSLEKTLMLAKIEDRRRRLPPYHRGRDYWMASPTQWIWANPRRQWRTGKPGVLQSVCACLVTSVVSDSLWPHGLQDTRPPYLSPTPRVYSNSCPLTQLFASGGQNTGVSASTSVLPMNIQGWSLGWTGWISL